MRTLLAICVMAAALAACTEDDSSLVPEPAPSGPEAVVFENGPALAQCAAPALTVSQSAAKLEGVGIPVRTSSCGVRTGVAYPAVCGAPTGQIILHNIPLAALTAAQVTGFHPAQGLVDTTRGTGWQRRSCQSRNELFDLARQSAGCANTRNRLIFITHPTRLDIEIVLLDQAGTCADANFRQRLYGETAADLLCSHAQSIAGPVKSCAVPSYAGLFDTMIANLDQPDLGLGQGYEVWEILVSP
jgi:hypothetical protein